MTFASEFVPVNKSKHHLKSYDCGVSSMNEYLLRFAYKNQQKKLNTTFVLETDIVVDGKLKVASYYTLAHTTISKHALVSSTGLPNYPVPVILLARLAVDKEFQGMAIGSKSLVYSLRHAYRVSNQEKGIPSFGLVLDVLNKKAMNIYQQFDFFEPMSKDPLRLFVSMSSLVDL